MRVCKGSRVRYNPGAVVLSQEVLVQEVLAKEVRAKDTVAREDLTCNLDQKHMGDGTPQGREKEADADEDCL